MNGTMSPANCINNSTPIGPVLLGLPGGFPSYGASYDRIWISDNGWISFQEPGSKLSR